MACSRDRRRVAHRRRQQHLHADRLIVLVGPRVQERDPDRRVRQGPREGTASSRSTRRSRRPPAAAADPDDVVRVHHGRGAAGVLVGRRRGDAPRHGYRGVLRHDRRDVLRPVPDAGVLRAAARGGAATPPHAPAIANAEGEFPMRKALCAAVDAGARGVRRRSRLSASGSRDAGSVRRRRLRRSSPRPTSSASSGKRSTTSS